MKLLIDYFHDIQHCIANAFLLCLNKNQSRKKISSKHKSKEKRMKQCITNWSWTSAGKKSSIVQVFNWLFPILTSFNNNTKKKKCLKANGSQKHEEKSRFSLYASLLFNMYNNIFFSSFPLFTRSTLFHLFCSGNANS